MNSIFWKGKYLARETNIKFQWFHLADIIGKELIPDPLNLAAELQVSQIPPNTVIGKRLKMNIMQNWPAPYNWSASQAGTRHVIWFRFFGIRQRFDNYSNSPINHLRLQLQMLSLSLKVEKRDIFCSFLHCVGHNRLPIDPGERVLQIRPQCCDSIIFISQPKPNPLTEQTKA